MKDIISHIKLLSYTSIILVFSSPVQGLALQEGKNLTSERQLQNSRTLENRPFEPFCRLTASSTSSSMPSAAGHRPHPRPWQTDSKSSIFQSAGVLQLPLEQKIGQLFIIPACQLRGEDHLQDLKRLIEKGLVGGIILKQGTAEGQRKLIAELQALSPVPLLCVQDGEWGVAMRLEDVVAFPRNLTLGAVQDLALLEQLGQEIGRQCRLVGTHLNLAPVVDVNCNPKNPIIHMRSFGESPVSVAERGTRVMRGIQSMGVMACAKHFPGHGDTFVDSHVDLPNIAHDRQRLEEIELFPFKTLINAGVKTVMTAHLSVEALTEHPLQPATFSKKIVTDLLQKELGFEGLVLTDALNMRALSQRCGPGEIAVQAFQAGHDMLLYGDHLAPLIDEILHIKVPQAQAALKAAVESGEITEEEIDRRVAKILRIKQELGLFQPLPDITQEEINSRQALALREHLFEEAITLVYDEGILPLQEEKIALIQFGESNAFKEAIEEVCEVDLFVPDDPTLCTKLAKYGCGLITLSGGGVQPQNFKLREKEKGCLRQLSQCGTPLIAVVLGTPYTLADLPPFAAVLIAYENAKEAQEAAAKVVLGQLPAKGKLPVSLR